MFGIKFVPVCKLLIQHYRLIHKCSSLVKRFNQYEILVIRQKILIRLQGHKYILTPMSEALTRYHCIFISIVTTSAHHTIVLEDCYEGQEFFKERPWIWGQIYYPYETVLAQDGISCIQTKLLLLLAVTVQNFHKSYPRVYSQQVKMNSQLILFTVFEYLAM